MQTYAWLKFNEIRSSLNIINNVSSINFESIKGATSCNENIISETKFYSYKSKFFDEPFLSTLKLYPFVPVRYLTLKDITTCHHETLRNICKITYYEHPHINRSVFGSNSKMCSVLSNIFSNTYYKENNNFNEFIKNMHTKGNGEYINILDYNAISAEKIMFNSFEYLKTLQIGCFYNHDIDNLPESLINLTINTFLAPYEVVLKDHWTKTENIKDKNIYINNLINLKSLSIEYKGILNELDISNCCKLQNLKLNFYNAEDINKFNFKKFPQSLENIEIIYCYDDISVDKKKIEIDLSYLSGLKNVSVKQRDGYVSKYRKSNNLPDIKVHIKH